MSGREANDGVVNGGEVNGGARIAVVLASAGRPELLAQAVRSCAGQQGVDFTGVISVPDQASLPGDGTEPGLLDGWRIAVGTRGLAAQRNAGMAQAPEADVFAFFDDDALLRPDYLARAVSFLDGHPGVVALTGRVLLDGATRGEISVERSAAALAGSGPGAASGRPSGPAPHPGPTLRPGPGPTSCTAATSSSGPGSPGPRASTRGCRSTPGWRITTSPGAACGTAPWPGSRTA